MKNADQKSPIFNITINYSTSSSKSLAFRVKQVLVESPKRKNDYFVVDQETNGKDKEARYELKVERFKS